MNTLVRSLCLVAVFAAMAAAAPSAIRAQEIYPQNVISANPLGLLLDFFNAEYERAINPTMTVGIGGSTFKWEDDFGESSPRYINADVFGRYYPSGRPFEGFNFGVKLGLTSITDEGTYFGYGFDANRSWLMGPSENFYVGLGIGLKRIVGADDQFLPYVWTIRLINIGYAF